MRHKITWGGESDTVLWQDAHYGFESRWRMRDYSPWSSRTSREESSLRFVGHPHRQLHGRFHVFRVGQILACDVERRSMID